MTDSSSPAVGVTPTQGRIVDKLPLVTWAAELVRAVAGIELVRTKDLDHLVSERVRKVALQMRDAAPKLAALEGAQQQIAEAHKLLNDGAPVATNDNPEKVLRDLTLPERIKDVLEGWEEQCELTDTATKELEGAQQRITELEALAAERKVLVGAMEQDVVLAEGRYNALQRETELRREAEAHNRELRAALERHPYPDEYDDMKQRAEAAEQRITELQDKYDRLLAAQQEDEHQRYKWEAKAEAADARLAALRKLSEKWQATKEGSERWIAAHRKCASEVAILLGEGPQQDKG